MLIYDSLWVPSYYKNELIKRINDSIYYSVSFGEAVNSVIQKCQY